MIDYVELLKKRRSIRNFEDKKIPIEVIHEVIHKVLEETCLAPSACNTQPWRFILIQDEKTLKKISDEAKRSTLERIEKYPDSPYSRFKELFSKPDYNIFYNAPALILIVGENNYPFFREDCTCATSYLMFAATARNLGTCWIGHVHAIEDAALKTEIGIPANYQIAAALILGYPKSTPTPPKRKDPIILKSIL